MSEVKFVSYDGEWPSRCMGTLVIEIGDKRWSLECVLSSGGCCRFDAEWNITVDEGDWEVQEEMLPEEIREYKDEIERVVNENVTKGCCGGCA